MIAGVDVSKLDQELVLALAKRQIELLTRPAPSKIAHELSGGEQRVSHAKSLPLESHPLAVPLQDGKMVMVSRRHLAATEVPRAVLTPLNGGEAFPMVSKRLAVGSGKNLH